MDLAPSGTPPSSVVPEMTVQGGRIIFTATSTTRLQFNDDIVPTATDVSQAVAKALEETLQALAEGL